MAHQLDIYREQQFGGRVGFGGRPAVLVVDFFYGCTDPAYLGAGSVGDAVDQTAVLLPAARAAGAPIIYTVTQYRPDGLDAGFFGVKVPLLKLLQEGSKAVEIDSGSLPTHATMSSSRRWPRLSSARLSKASWHPSGATR